jgi:holo-[acyl-carrier protein] synthase
MTNATPPAYLFGIDVLATDRVASMMARHGEALMAALVGPGDHGALSGADLAAAVTLAVKEATIKAVGGRPAGFCWPDIEVADAPRDDAVPAHVGALFDEFSRAAAFGLAHCVTVHLGPALAAAAAPQILPLDTRSFSHLRGSGQWGEIGGQVFAVVALWTAEVI